MERESILAELEVEAKASGRPKSQIVLDALEGYLAARRGGAEPRLGAWDLGAVEEFHRADLYEERA